MDRALFTGLFLYQFTWDIFLFLGDIGLFPVFISSTFKDIMVTGWHKESQGVLFPPRTGGKAGVHGTRSKRTLVDLV